MKQITTQNELDLALSNDFSLILSKTNGCSVCGAIKQRLELIEDTYKDIPFYEIYIEDLPTFQGQYLVFTVPTVLIFEKEKELLRESRFVNIRNITKLLDNIKN